MNEASFVKTKTTYCYSNLTKCVEGGHPLRDPKIDTAHRTWPAQKRTPRTVDSRYPLRKG